MITVLCYFLRYIFYATEFVFASLRSYTFMMRIHFWTPECDLFSPSRCQHPILNGGLGHQGQRWYVSFPTLRDQNPERSFPLQLTHTTSISTGRACTTFGADSDTEVSLSVYGIGKAAQSKGYLYNFNPVRCRERARDVQRLQEQQRCPERPSAHPCIGMVQYPL